MNEEQKEAYIWEVNLVKERYHDLDLRFDQMEKIYLFEKFNDKFHLLNDVHLGDFERREYFYLILKSILDTEQYERFHKSNINQEKQLEASIIEADENRQGELDELQQTIRFFRDDLHRPLMRDTRFRLLAAVFSKKSNYLANEYHDWLKARRQRISFLHFRTYRDLAPNALKLALLRLELEHIWPNYQDFSTTLDEVSKTIAHYLYQRFEDFRFEHAAELQSISNRIRAYFKPQQETQKARGGWHVIIKEQDEEESKKNFFMSIVLLNSTEYEWKSNNYQY